MPAQTDFFDAQLRHHIGIQRLSAGEAKKVLALLEKSDKEIVRILRKRAKVGDFTSQRYKEMLADIRTLRKELMKELATASSRDLRALAKAEQKYAATMLQDALPVKLDFATVDAGKLSTLVTENPFTAGTNAARSLGQWWSGLATADGNRIIEAVQLGMVQSETIDQMVGRVVAATDMTRNNATAVVRTAVNHASNSARNAFFAENKDIVSSLMWSAMLDGRTTIICASLDGHYTTADGSGITDAVPSPHMDDPLFRPPAHVNCRSYMVGVLDAGGISDKMPDRAFVRDTRTRRFRERDFRAEAKAGVGAKQWKAMSIKERNAAIAGKRRAWAEANIGHVPARTTYGEWLQKQPKTFQDDVLGPGKAQLFRNGMGLDKFVDRDGGELTLAQLMQN